MCLADVHSELLMRLSSKTSSLKDNNGSLMIAGRNVHEASPEAEAVSAKLVVFALKTKHGDLAEQQRCNSNKSVSFGHVTVREFSLTIGDSINSRDSCPLQLDWKFCQKPSIPEPSYGVHSRFLQSCPRLTLTERRQRLTVVAGLTIDELSSLEMGLLRARRKEQLELQRLSDESLDLFVNGFLDPQQKPLQSQARRRPRRHTCDMAVATVLTPSVRASVSNSAPRTPMRQASLDKVEHISTRLPDTSADQQQEQHPKRHAANTGPPILCRAPSIRRFPNKQSSPRPSEKELSASAPMNRRLQRQQPSLRALIAGCEIASPLSARRGKGQQLKQQLLRRRWPVLRPSTDQLPQQCPVYFA